MSLLRSCILPCAALLTLSGCGPTAEQFSTIAVGQQRDSVLHAMGEPYHRQTLLAVVPLLDLEVLAWRQCRLCDERFLVLSAGKRVVATLAIP